MSSAHGALQFQAVTVAASRPSTGVEPAPRPKVYLHPGVMFVGPSPVEVTTILGTCVSVFLWDPTTRLGGVNHYLLPMVVGEAEASPRFGVVAVPKLIDDVLALGARRQRLQAKVFGGMCSLRSPPARDLGTGNVELAFRLLTEARIPVVAQSVGGTRGRKVLFDFDEGGVLVKEL